jgi:L-malate glycosyltransferase
MNLLVLGETGGLENSTRPEISKYIYLAQHGFNITIMGNPHGIFVRELTQYGIDIVEAKYGKKVDLKLIKDIRKIVKEKKIDLIYASASRTISNAIVASFFLDVKVVTYRGTTGGLYWYDPGSYLNALNPRVDGVICVSESVKIHVDAKLLSKKTNTAAIYKGHNISWYDVKANDLTEFDTSTENFNVAFVGNIRPHKGLEYLLQALPALSHLKKLHILLIGEKINKEPFVSLIEKSGMSERIHVTGHRSDVPAILHSCDLLVHASTRKEGLPRIIIEALACNTPVIASDNDSSLEIIENDVNGYIVPKKDPKAIEEKIEYLYNNEDILTRLKQNTQEIIKNGKLSHEKTAEKYGEFFKKIIKQ